MELMSDAAFSNVHGGSDSEHLAALYMTYLTDSGPTSDFEKEYPASKMAWSLHEAVEKGESV